MGLAGKSTLPHMRVGVKNSWSQIATSSFISDGTPLTVKKGTCWRSEKQTVQFIPDQKAGLVLRVPEYCRGRG